MQCCLVFISVHNEYSLLTQSANSICANKSIGQWCDGAMVRWRNAYGIKKQRQWFYGASLQYHRVIAPSSAHHCHRTIAASHYRFIRPSPSHRRTALVMASSSPHYRTIVIELSRLRFIDPNLDGAMVNYVALSGLQTEYNFCVRIRISYINHLFPLYYFLILLVNWVFLNFLLENICFHDGNVSFPMTYR